MSSEYDVALLGTGLAPLVAAARFIALGKTVLLLNPDWDFFREDSELPLDPVWPVTSHSMNPQRLSQSAAQRTLSELRPDFPGPIEHWSERALNESKGSHSSYHDPEAPHVRSRSRIWVRSELALSQWEAVEGMYVEASDAGLHPLLLEGHQVTRHFPGHSGKGSDDLKAIQVPDFTDVDVDRYRNGLLEYIRERMDSSKIVFSATQIELAPGGVRFYSGTTDPKGWRTARLINGLIVYWTPRLTRWALSNFDRSRLLPKGEHEGRVQVWEQWSLVSRELLDSSTMGVFEDMIVWSEAKGSEKPGNLLTVLRPGESFSIADPDLQIRGVSWIGQESFASLSRLCGGFLGWDKLSVRSMRPRVLFSWNDTSAIRLQSPHTGVWMIRGCDGPLVDVVRNARNSVELFA